MAGIATVVAAISLSVPRARDYPRIIKINFWRMKINFQIVQHEMKLGGRERGGGESDRRGDENSKPAKSFRSA